MNEFFKNLNQDKLLKRGYILNSFVILLNFFYILLYFGNLPPFIPLYNQLPWGEQRITETIWIFMMPVLALLIFSINLIASSTFYKKNPLIARLFSVTSFMISVLIFLFIVRTIQAVL